MHDSRNTELARQLVRFSCNVQPGENVMIESRSDVCNDLVIELVKELYAVGAKPYVRRTDERIQRAIMMGISEEQADLMAEVDAGMMRKMQSYILICGNANSQATKDVPAERRAIMSKHYSKPVHSDVRVKYTKWCYLEYPTPSQAQSAGMSTEAFEDFYYKVCCMDYQKMEDALEPLKQLIERTDKVHILGKGTDLTFSIKGIGARKGAGHWNLPDGEIFTAPVRDSVNGVISYNIPSSEAGFVFKDVVLKFKDGKIVEATCNDNERINKLLDTDENARYIGEFAFGVSPYFKEPMNNILYDEKIDGSFHFTPGDCYDEAYNGNRSAIHWDLVCVQRPEYGGGEIWFDDVLIRKDGRFVLPELECLNPENLI